ncbi:MAG: LamG-like jellyroll fold domain-containing protein [Gammaproteobacteria bacterium]
MKTKYLTIAASLCGVFQLFAGSSASLALPWGIAHHWDGEGDTMDIVGGADGSEGETTAYVAGISGRGFSFDGAQSSVVSLPVDIGPAARPRMTMGMWVKLRSVAKHRGWIIGHDSAGINRSIHLSDGRVGIAGDTGENPHNSSLIRLSEHLHTWVCVAAAYDAASQTATFYAAGKSQTVVATPGTGQPTATLGGMQNFITQPVDAVIDEVFIYDRILDADEVADACSSLANKDGDGVADTNDLCLGTPPDTLVAEDGCSGAQEVALACGSRANWRSTGRHLDCVTDAAVEALHAGLISDAEYARIISDAANSHSQFAWPVENLRGTTNRVVEVGHRPVIAIRKIAD